MIENLFRFSLFSIILCAMCIMFENVYKYMVLLLHICPRSFVFCFSVFFSSLFSFAYWCHAHAFFKESFQKKPFTTYSSGVYLITVSAVCIDRDDLIDGPSNALLQVSTKFEWWLNVRGFGSSLDTQHFHCSKLTGRLIEHELGRLGLQKPLSKCGLRKRINFKQ